MSDSHVKKLVEEHLCRPGVLLSRKGRDWGREVLARGGRGLALIEGEQVLAAGGASEIGGPDGRRRPSFAVTDGRFAWVSADGQSGSLRLERVLGVTRRGVLAKRLELITASGPVPVSVDTHLGPLAAFFTAVAKLPESARRPASVPLARPSQGDPTGAISASRSLWAEDPRATLLFELTHTSIGRGTAAVDGADLVSRAVYAHRSSVAGAGMWDGWWVMPLSQADLEQTFSRFFGQPRDRSEEEPGIVCLELELDPGAGSLDWAVGSAAISTGSLAAVVDAIKALASDEPITDLRVLLVERAGWTCYEILAPIEPLALRAPELLLVIQDGLAAAAYQVLLRRCLYGWAPDHDDLMSLPREAVAWQLSECLGRGDLDSFDVV